MSPSSNILHYLSYSRYISIQHKHAETRAKTSYLVPRSKDFNIAWCLLHGLYPSILLLMCSLFFYPCTICLFIYRSIQEPFYPGNLLSISSCVCLVIHLCALLSIPSCVCLFIYPCTLLSISSGFHLFIYPCNLLSISSSIHVTFYLSLHVSVYPYYCRSSYLPTINPYIHDIHLSVNSSSISGLFQCPD